jgi:hypothetical protein
LAALINRLQYHLLTKRVSPPRYRNVFRLIHDRRYKRIVEVGVWNGKTAERMIRTAAIFHRPSDIQYFGFDLWELLTDDLFASELSKRPPAKAEVQARLGRTGAAIELIQGNTKETVPESVGRIGHADLVFIDGGHSEETIRSDWTHAQKLMRPGSTVIFDDYYVDPPAHIATKGCQNLLDALDRSTYNVELLSPVDEFRHPWGVLRTRMAAVSLAR